MTQIATPLCPMCGVWTFVKETRITAPGVRRRFYECANGHRFVTEVTEKIIRIKDDAKYKTVPPRVPVYTKVQHSP